MMYLYNRLNLGYVNSRECWMSAPQLVCKCNGCQCEDRAMRVIYNPKQCSKLNLSVSYRNSHWLQPTNTNFNLHKKYIYKVLYSIRGSFQIKCLAIISSQRCLIFICCRKNCLLMHFNDLQFLQNTMAQLLLNLPT